MSKDFGTESIQDVANAAQQQQQVQVTIDDSQAAPQYSSNARVWGSAEEINLDFAGAIKPTGPKTAVLKIEQRVILNPFAAKRLALLLGSYLQQFEATYGVIELDERKRRLAQPTASATTKPN